MMINWEKHQQFFRPEEFACKCGCGLLNVEPELIERLMIARDRAKFPFVITSGSRCPAHNGVVGGSRTSAHLTGQAADIRCASMFTRLRLIDSLRVAGFARIGISSTFVHVDIDLARPWGIYLY
jgi:zinc D-Ala-D-Ala carboxypeptidase